MLGLMVLMWQASQAGTITRLARQDTVTLSGNLFRVCLRRWRTVATMRSR